jgi:hypothetical protein
MYVALQNGLFTPEFSTKFLYAIMQRQSAIHDDVDLYKNIRLYELRGADQNKRKEIRSTSPYLPSK